MIVSGTSTICCHNVEWSMNAPDDTTAKEAEELGIKIRGKIKFELTNGRESGNLRFFLIREKATLNGPWLTGRWSIAK